MGFANAVLYTIGGLIILACICAAIGLIRETIAYLMRR
jgi:hypothetical protein